MDMVRRRVRLFSRDYRRARHLMKRVFPSDELFPIPFLLVQSFRRGIDFYAYYDNGVFCGISYTVRSRNLVFLLYLAVDESLHSKGYGSRILTAVTDSLQGLPIALNIEPVETEAPNYEARIRRLRFYERNGFKKSGYRMKDEKEEYQILTNTDAFDPEAYMDALRYFSISSEIPSVVKDDL